MKIRKHHFLLLEVIIAFILIVLCIIPLISPHTFILIEQKKFIHEIELDHVVNLTYADIVERLYRNDISWNAILNEEEFEIDDALLQRINYEKTLPYEGKYRFKEILHKPGEESLRTLYLMALNMTFTPTETEHKGGASKALNYHYELFIIRDLGVEEQVINGSETEGSAP